MLTRNKIYVSTNNSKNITSSVKSHITIIDIKNKDNTTCDLCDRRSGKSKNNILYLAGVGEKPCCPLSGSKIVSQCSVLPVL